MIQALDSSCDALQYEPVTKFFHLAVPKIHDIKNDKIQWCFLKNFAEYLMVSQLLVSG